MEDQYQDVRLQLEQEKHLLLESHKTILYCLGELYECLNCDPKFYPFHPAFTIITTLQGHCSAIIEESK